LGGFVVLVEYAGSAVAWKPWVEACEGVGYSLVDIGGPGWVGPFECSEAFAEAGCVLMGNREDADAALGAARMADEVMMTASIGIGYGGVYDLDEGLHTMISRKVRASRDSRIPKSRYENLCSD
jgi:hypothetical protein